MIRYQLLSSSPRPERAHNLAIFMPDTLTSDLPAIFIVRNGSWRSAPNAPMHIIANAFTSKGFIAGVACFSPTAKDAFEQLAELREIYQRFQEELVKLDLPRRVVVLGMGAGGHLGSLLTCAAPGACGETFTSSSPWIAPIAGCFITTLTQFTPWPELFHREWADMQAIAGASYPEHKDVYERLSLKNYLDGELPPLFFAEGAENHLHFPYFSRNIVEKLQARGQHVQWKLYPLGGANFLNNLEWRPQLACFDDILAFIDSLPHSQKPEKQISAPAPGKRENGRECYGVYLDNPIHPKRGLDIFLPPANQPIADTAFFMIHGGGWRFGDRTKLNKIAEAFARHGIVTASSGYRQDAPTVFEMLADVRETYDAFIGELKRLGRPLRTVVYGESAGAHLASLLAAAKPGECGETCQLVNDWVAPAAMILQSAQAQYTPWPDINPDIWRTMSEIAGAPYSDAPERYERLSLSRYICKDTPAIFWSEAQFEDYFPHYLNTELARRMASLGITTYTKCYALAEHGFFYDLVLPQQLEFFQDILHFLKGETNAIENLQITEKVSVQKVSR